MLNFDPDNVEHRVLKGYLNQWLWSKKYKSYKEKYYWPSASRFATISFLFTTEVLPKFKNATKEINTNGTT